MRAYTVVTGAAGFVGRAVLPRLAEEVPSGQLVGLDLRQRPHGWCGEWLEGGLERLHDLHGPVVVVHLAWDLRRGDAGAQEASLWAFQKMLRLPNLSGIVGMGSAEEYGSEVGRLEEGMAPGPGLSAYGRAKHEALLATEAAGVRCVWLRPFIIYGEGQSGNMVVPYALRCVREGTVAEFSAGEQFRDFVHVDDVADGIAAAVWALGGLREEECRVCNLGRGEPVRVRDVLERIARRTGREEFFRFGVRSMRVGEPSVQFAATEAAETTLGWKATIPWQEGIDRLCVDLEKTE